MQIATWILIGYAIGFLAGFWFARQLVDKHWRPSVVRKVERQLEESDKDFTVTAKPLVYSPRSVPTSLKTHDRYSSAIKHSGKDVTK
jgi:hypothetical protein